MIYFIDTCILTNDHINDIKCLYDYLCLTKNDHFQGRSYHN